LLLIVAAVVGLYVIATSALFIAQRAMIYPAPRQAFAARDAFPGFRQVHLQTSDGLRLQAIHRPASDSLPTVIFFHGNGDNLHGAVEATRLLGAAGYGLLLPEYRGYSGNPGSPTEAGLYRDGEAALQWLRQEGVPVIRMVLIGNSLGSGVATELATRHSVRGLVLVSGFSSLADVAALHVRLFPVRLLLRDRYNNQAKLPKVRASVLILHGANDSLIPAAQSVELAKAVKGASLVIEPDAGHELAYLPQAQRVILKWLGCR
jgi:fermentation-respiration switch protein FrsA (DUF1100 family)